MGVRCLTLHAAKGTEADVIHILDCENDIIPNVRKIKDMIESNCIVDSAREIRNERSLVYVGKTRAKHKLYIHYSNELSSMFTDRNAYDVLDAEYESYTPSYSDVKVFESFFI